MDAFPELVRQEVRHQISLQLVELSFIEVANVVEAILQLLPEHASQREELRAFIVQQCVAKGVPLKF
ncbi:MAG: hypothetical protein KF735_02165 [Chelatococcus sp.]|uniref:hypothetical protein n=1 Tax=Chelatococcus sp. TaxID=1953771 RepID=UPI0025B94295|nr:hypothetical protein [Chelatococcus sp.]MBX3536417.1 hypothetical protein [Chelatococcus sp.]